MFLVLAQKTWRCFWISLTKQQYQSLKKTSTDSQFWPIILEPSISLTVVVNSWWDLKTKKMISRWLNMPIVSILSSSASIKLRVNLFVENLRGMDGLCSGLANLPAGLVLEVIRHPATVIYENPAQNEQTLFLIAMTRLSSENNASVHVLKLLESIHLPQTSAEFLETTETQFGHIPGVKDLIEEAKKEVNPAERRKWDLARYQNQVLVVLGLQDKPIVVDGQETNWYFPCVLIKGFHSSSMLSLGVVSTDLVLRVQSR